MPLVNVSKRTSVRRLATRTRAAREHQGEAPGTRLPACHCGFKLAEAGTGTDDRGPPLPAWRTDKRAATPPADPVRRPAACWERSSESPRNDSWDNRAGSHRKVRPVDTARALADPPSRATAVRPKNRESLRRTAMKAASLAPERARPASPTRGANVAFGLLKRRACR